MLLALALLMATLACFAARVHWFFELFSHFRWQYVVVGALAAVLCAKTDHHALAVCCVVTVAIHSLGLGEQRFADAPRIAVSGHTLRVLSLNVYFRNDGYQAVIDYARRLSPDIICLYETTPAWERGLAPLTASYAFTLFTGDGPHSGIACLSRIVPMKVVPPTSDSGVTPWMDLQLESRGVRFSLLAAHLAFPIGPAGSAARNRQLASLARQLQAIDGPALVIGDFNLSPYSPMNRDFLAQSRFDDCSQGGPLVPTWPAGFAPLWITIDRCFTRNGIAIAGYRVGPAVGSDHYPVVIDFALPVSDGHAGP